MSWIVGCSCFFLSVTFFIARDWLLHCNVDHMHSTYKYIYAYIRTGTVQRYQSILFHSTSLSLETFRKNVLTSLLSLLQSINVFHVKCIHFYTEDIPTKAWCYSVRCVAELLLVFLVSELHVYMDFNIYSVLGLKIIFYHLYKKNTVYKKGYR